VAISYTISEDVAVRGRSARSVTWSCGLVRSSADALEPRRMRPELRPARSPSPMVFKSICGSWSAAAATCVVGARGWLVEQDHPAYIPCRFCPLNPRIKRQAHPCRESSRIVRSSSLAWIFALAAVHRDPAPSDGVAARVAASVSVVAAGPNRISSSSRSCPDRFKLDQRRWSVFPGRCCTVVSCDPNCVHARHRGHSLSLGY
jgi:hypothetical protein